MIQNHRISFGLLIYLFFSLPFFYAQNHSYNSKKSLIYPSQNASYFPNTFILKINPAYRHLCSAKDIKILPLKDALENYQVKEIQKLFPDIKPPNSFQNQTAQELADLSLIYHITYEDTTDLYSILYHLSSFTAIEYAEPWYVNEVFYHPNDFYADTIDGAPGMWHLQKIQAQEGWEIERDVEDVTVGVIDTGIKFDHEDLQDNIAFNVNDPVDGIDNDGDGYIDNYRGWDLGGPIFGGLGDNNPEIAGNNDHGVGVAGIVAATTDNRIGTAGVCFNCKYLPIKGSADDFANSISHGYQGIIYAVEQGAEIVNCSWGSNIRTRLGEDVVKYATINKGAAVIAAAGNSESDLKFYPAAYDEVISVVNTTRADTLCCNSTYNYSADVAAPGRNLIGPVGSGGYSNLFGTSYASPLVSGVVAVVKAHFPNYTGFQAAQRVRITTDDISTLNSRVEGKIGSGRVNLYRALTDPAKPSIRKLREVISDTDNDFRFVDGDTLLLALDFINYLERAENLNVSISLPEEEDQLYTEILQGTFQAGSVDMFNQFSNTQTPFTLRLKEGVPVDFELAIKVTYTDIASGYSDFEYIEFRVNKSYLNVLENKLHTTITSKGNFGFNDFANNKEGLGLIYREGTNTLFEGGFLVGLPTGQVSDNIRNVGGTQDYDFWPEVQTYRIHESAIADFHAFSSFRDQGSPQPIGIKIDQHTYAFNDASYENFIIFQYVIHNENNAALKDVYAGLFADWDIADFSKNISNYDRDAGVVFAYDALGFNPNFYGMGLLSHDTLHAYATTNPSSFRYTDVEKFQAISNLPTAITATAGVSTGGADIMHFIGGGIEDILAKDSMTFAFAILAAPTYQQFILAQEAAQEKYDCVILDKGPNKGFSIDTLAASVVGTPIAFMDNNDTGLSWQWDFGDGNTSEAQNPSHIYQVPGVYHVTMTVSDGVCEVEQSQRITVELNTTLIGESESYFHLYPNPMTAQLTLSLESPWTGALEISLFNLHGQKVYHTSTYKRYLLWNTTLAISHLPKGVYELHMKGEGLDLHRKIVKK